MANKIFSSKHYQKSYKGHVRNTLQNVVKRFVGPHRLAEKHNVELTVVGDYPDRKLKTRWIPLIMSVRAMIYYAVIHASSKVEVEFTVADGKITAEVRMDGPALEVADVAKVLTDKDWLQAKKIGKELISAKAAVDGGDNASIQAEGTSALGGPALRVQLPVG